MQPRNDCDGRQRTHLQQIAVPTFDVEDIPPHSQERAKREHNGYWNEYRIDAPSYERTRGRIERHKEERDTDAPSDKMEVEDQFDLSVPKRRRKNVGK